MSGEARGGQPSKWAVVRSASGQLPVYRDIRNHNSRELTIIRKVLGDLNALRESLVREFNVDAKHVFVKAGRVEVKGRHKHEIAQWLESKGF
jgi:large subunit ribosomal protein L49